MSEGAPPAGYLRVTIGRHDVVTCASLAADAHALLAKGTIYDAAAQDPGARPLQGRGVAYAITLPISAERVVVRHNRHGGFLAGLTGDLFFTPTRAPYELDVALRLAAAGVRTPVVLMYGITTAAIALRRSDVMTREVEGSRDLSSFLSATEPTTSRAEAWEATRGLVRALDAAGARHHDLNVKNVLLSREGGELVAHVLDVDRVTFGRPDSTSVRQGNARRLLRSARKWRDRFGAVFDEREIAALGTLHYRP